MFNLFFFVNIFDKNLLHLISGCLSPLSAFRYTNNKFDNEKQICFSDLSHSFAFKFRLFLVKKVL